ncbi:MAG TPA: hypothetical protein V6C89_05555 [Drouetiella sp.]|jgi:hypothetical protein
MNKLIGAMLMASAWLAQMQAYAQSADQMVSQAPQLQPAMPAQLDANLRGAIGGQTTAQSSAPMPFTSTSPYSYSEPTGTGNDPQVQPVLSAPVSGPGTVQSPTSPVSKRQKQKKHGFSPVGAIFGVQDRAVKSSLGLTDRTAKAGLGITGKTTKEIFKAVF